MGEPTPPFWEYPIPLWLFITSIIVVAIVGIEARIARKRVRGTNNV
jgi:hypothetical protein